MVSLAAQEWLKQGKAEGLAEGKAEGLRSARRDDLLDILEARFGPVDPSVRERINSMSADDLRPLLRRAATAATIADVLDGPSSH